jgi:hypothetical protein
MASFRIDPDAMLAHVQATRPAFDYAGNKSEKRLSANRISHAHADAGLFHNA